jgi:hypothetical protein
LLDDFRLVAATLDAPSPDPTPIAPAPTDTSPPALGADVAEARDPTVEVPDDQLELF